jgi:hypothetical protein
MPVTCQTVIKLKSPVVSRAELNKVFFISEYQLESKETKRTHKQDINCKNHIQTDRMTVVLLICCEHIMNGRSVFLHVIVGYNRFIFHFERVLI